MNEPHVTPGEQSTPPRDASRVRTTAMMSRPPKALWLIVAVLVAVLIGGTLTFLQGDEPDAEPDTAESPASKPVPRIEAFASKFETQIRDLEQRIQELVQQWALHEEQAGQQIAENAQALDALQETVAALPTSEQLARLEGSIKTNREALAKEITRIEADLKSLQAAERGKQAKPAPPSLPFKVVSIDLWDGVPYVGLVHDERIELLRAGQSRAGWTVQQIDTDAGQVTLRSAEGRTLVRSIRR
ncbi:MAG: hypothetical protein U5R46_08560 [Gammaproteobacteria bacterium]|nr:hypothetical protein [Gammaproteobacteria bacterium]